MLTFYKFLSILSIKNGTRIKPFSKKRGTEQGQNRSRLRTQRTERDGPFSTKNTKNRKERNVDGTIGKRTNKDGTI